MSACGGCRGLGRHRRWCPVIVGRLAAIYGPESEAIEALGDQVGSNDPSVANALYHASSRLRAYAQGLSTLAPMTTTPIAATLRAGDYVTVKPGIDVPEWATGGVVVNPHSTPRSGDNYLHPSVRWEDGKTRIVPDTWLVRTAVCPTCRRP